MWKWKKKKKKNENRSDLISQIHELIKNGGQVPPELMKEMSETIQDKMNKGKEEINGIIEWAKENRSESDECLRKSEDVISTLLSKSISHNQALLSEADNLVALSKAILLYGYKLGRTYQDVPEIFKKG